MPPDYDSFPLRKDFYLADDAARSPGAGIRPMERTHAPSNASVSDLIRRTPA
jgi:NADH:ubiquinone oxidoreductase subunit C